MAGEHLGDELRPPTSAKPVGRERWPRVTAPRSAGVGLDFPGRGELDATAAWELGTEPEDAPDAPDLTPRERNAL